MEQNKFNPHLCVCHLEGAAMLLMHQKDKGIIVVTNENIVDHMEEFIRSSAHVCCEKNEDERVEKREEAAALRIQNLKETYFKIEANMRFYRDSIRQGIYRTIVLALRKCLGIK